MDGKDESIFEEPWRERRIKAMTDVVKVRSELDRHRRCPLCGGPIYVEWNEGIVLGDITIEVGCTECGCRYEGEMYEPVESVMAKWDKRV